MPTLLSGCDSPKKGNGAATPACDPAVAPCPLACKLVSLTVIFNATRTNVTGSKNWATVRKATDDVIVQAKTSPDTEDCWKAIKWSGDSGSPGDKPNQRKLSRTTSKKLHLEAELGGVKESLDVWVLWATVTINVSGTTPVDSAQFGTIGDGTENLGAKSYDGGKAARGKVAPIAIITPAGVHDVVKSGWAFKRQMTGHVWIDGAKVTGDPRFWKPDWSVDDTSATAFTRLTPTADEKIYDLDGPSILAVGTSDAEVYYNFRQYIQWNGDMCSDYSLWYWQGRWQKSASPQVTLKDVGTGNIALPNDSHFHP